MGSFLACESRRQRGLRGRFYRCQIFGDEKQCRVGPTAWELFPGLLCMPEHRDGSSCLLKRSTCDMFRPFAGETLHAQAAKGEMRKASHAAKMRSDMWSMYRVNMIHFQPIE